MPRDKRKALKKQGSQHNEKLIDDDIFSIMQNNPINEDLQDYDINQLAEKNLTSISNIDKNKGAVPIVEDISPKRAGRFERKKQKENILKRTLTATPPPKKEKSTIVQENVQEKIQMENQHKDDNIADILEEFPSTVSSTIEFEKPHTSEKVIVAETPTYTLYEELEVDPLEEIEEPLYKVCDTNDKASNNLKSQPSVPSPIPQQEVLDIQEQIMEESTATIDNQVVLSKIDVDNMDIPIVDDMPKRNPKFSVHIEDDVIEQDNIENQEQSTQRVTISQTLEEAKALPSYNDDTISQDDVLKVLLGNEDIPTTQTQEIEDVNLSANGKEEITYEESFDIPVDDIKNDVKKIETQETISKELSIDNIEQDNLIDTKKIKKVETLSETKILDKIDTAKKELNAKPKRKHNNKINLKSTPDIDFLEINVPKEETQDTLNNDQNTSKQRRKKGFDDFHNKKDAEALFNDLLDLRGSIVFRVALLTIITLVSGYISLANNYNLPTFDVLKSNVSASSFIFIQLIIGLVAMVSSLNLIVSGIKKFFTMKSDSDSLSALSFTVTFIASLASLSATEMVGRGIIHVYIPVGIASLLFNAIGKLITVDRAINNFEVVSSNVEHYAIMCVENEEFAERVTRGTFVDYPILAKMKKTDFLTDFLKYTYSYDIADKYCKFATPIIFGISVVFATISALLFKNSFIGYEWQVGLSFLSLLISLCACLGMTLLVNIPLLKVSEKYPPMMGALLGYQSVDDFYDVNSVMIDAETLFPRGTVRLSAIKTFSDTKIDDAIIDAASLTEYAGSIMRYMFNDVIVGNTKMLRKVENYVYEDSNGICGWINNKRVLLGNRELMVSHSIEGIPTKTKELEFTGGQKEAVYLSVSGNLSAMFIVDMKPNFYVKQAFAELEHNNVCVMIKSIDSIVTISKVAKLFSIPEEMIKVIPNKLHTGYQEEINFTSKQSASMTCANDFVTFSQLLISTKRIRKTAIMGLVLQSTSALLGILIALSFIVLKSFDQVTTSMLLIYNLVWTILTVITAYLRKE